MPLGFWRNFPPSRVFPENSLRSSSNQLSWVNQRWIFIDHNCLKFLTSTGYLSELSLSKSFPISKPGDCLAIIKMQAHLSVHRLASKVSKTQLVFKHCTTKVKLWFQCSAEYLIRYVTRTQMGVSTANAHARSQVHVATLQKWPEIQCWGQVEDFGKYMTLDTHVNAAYPFSARL